MVVPTRLKWQIVDDEGTVELAGPLTVGVVDLTGELPVDSGEYHSHAQR